MRCYLLFATAIAISSVVSSVADEPAANDEPKQNIVLEDVMKRLTAQIAELDAKMAELESKHLAAVKKLESSAIMKLADIAERAVGNSQLARGIEAYKEILKLDPTRNRIAG